MTYRFTLPDLGEGLVDAEIREWLVAVGDRVRRDQPLVEVETAKAVLQIPCPAAGTVVALGGSVGEVLPVGALLVELSDHAADAADAAGPGPGGDGPGGAGGDAGGDGTSAAEPETPTAARATAAAAGRPARRALASPSTRARAVALGLDLSTITGTGPAGRVTRADVERAASPPEPQTTGAATATGQGTAAMPPAPARGASPVAGWFTSEPGAGGQRADHDEPLRGIRRQIARTLAASWQQIPHVTEFREVDASQLVRAHQALRDRWPADRPRLTLLPLMAWACVRALGRHPVLNASLEMDREIIRYHGAVHLGIATAAPDGLTVPVVRDADRMDLAQLSAGIAAAADAARSRRATPGELTGATFTISNFGSNGTWLGTPIITPPQVGIVGFGRVRDAVVAVDGRAVVRPTLPLAVSADHRLVDGDVLGAFVTDIAALLRDPVLLWATGG